MPGLFIYVPIKNIKLYFLSDEVEKAAEVTIRISEMIVMTGIRYSKAENWRKIYVLDF